MFTGLIEEVGIVMSLSVTDRGGRIRVNAEKVLNDLKVGDSIAVSGACLTATHIHNGGFTADISLETLSRTTLGNLKVGDQVNLERSLRLSDRLGGHLVLGHVDEVGRITWMKKKGESVMMGVRVSNEGIRYVVEKGSVCVDGISLTVANLVNDIFEVALIPHTIEMTSLKSKTVGSRVNIEFDIVGKYVERLLLKSNDENSRVEITLDFLREHGFS